MDLKKNPTHSATVHCTDTNSSTGQGNNQAVTRQDLDILAQNLTTVFSAQIRAICNTIMLHFSSKCWLTWQIRLKGFKLDWSLVKMSLPTINSIMAKLKSPIPAKGTRGEERDLNSNKVIDHI